MMSVRMPKRSPSFTSPMAMPATCDLSGTPASMRASEAPQFADRERREVVVQHEMAIRLALQRLDLLLVGFRAERGRHKRLRLAAGEESRAVGARQVADLDRD